VFIKKQSCEKCIVYEAGDIKKIISSIEKGGLRIALILNSSNKLEGTITDGDIRRGLLKGLSLDSPFSKILRKDCFTATVDTNRKEIVKMMRDNAISQIPIISENNEFIGLEISEELLPSSRQFTLPNFALLMAGGRGSRLRPITDDCPKPLLPINNKPILEIILEQCISSGIRNFYISVHYLADKIINYFGDGSKWNVNIKYIREDLPLGTAGSLKLIPEELSDPLILINGDVLTKTNFQNVLNYHSKNNAQITICAREQILSSPYGVIEVSGINFESMVEKPSFRQLVNAGIYVLNPFVISFLKEEKYLDMPELIMLCKEKQKKIIVYPVHEYWLDIGKPETLDKAHYDWKLNDIR
tara:strand:- start:470 stop:1543 length:1074 start_codon:yes stop_codon:yes gene_type:complete